MIDFLIVVGGMFAAAAPIGALAAVIAYRRARQATGAPDPLSDQQLLYAPAAAFGVLVIAALISGPLLDVLSVSTPAFQFASAAAMLPLAIRLIVAGDSMSAPGWKLPEFAWLVPFTVPLLAGPTSILAAIAYGQRTGEIETIVAAAIVLAATAALFATLSRWQKQRLLVIQMAGRVSGVFLVGMAVEMALDGLRAI